MFAIAAVGRRRAGMRGVPDSAFRSAGVGATSRGPGLRLLLYGLSSHRRTMPAGFTQRLSGGLTYMTVSTHGAGHGERRRPRRALAAAALCAATAASLLSAGAAP